MKIGILTYHRPCNFGANLQAYASSNYLISLGHEVKVIDYVREVDRSHYKKSIPSIQYKAHQAFVDNYLPLTRQATNECNLLSIVDEEAFDLLLIGADAVWRASEEYRVYFGCWLTESNLSKRVRVASLSPAIMGAGLSTLSEEKKSEIRNSLKKFACVSVRDCWTKTVIENDIFDGQKTVDFVNPDPVTVIDTLINDVPWASKGLTSKQYVVMTLPTDWLKGRKLAGVRLRWFIRFKKYINRAGFQLIELPLPEGPTGLPFDKVYNQPIEPLQWYLTLKNARAYCGLRFHAIVSCIAAGVPFYSMDVYCDRPSWTVLLDLMGLDNLAKRYDKNSKIYNLLAEDGLDAYRNGGFIELTSAKRIAKKLLSVDPKSIEKVSKRRELEYANNIKTLLAKLYD